jgi:hypothetical protein
LNEVIKAQDEAADRAAKHQREHRRHAGRTAELAPAEHRADQDENQQKAGLVDGAVDRHGLVAMRDDRATGSVEESILVECRVAALHDELP